MNIQELVAFRNGYEIAAQGIIDLMGKHINKISQEMIHALEDFSMSISYNIDAMIEGQTNKDIAL